MLTHSPVNDIVASFIKMNAPIDCMIESGPNNGMYSATATV